MNTVYTIVAEESLNEKLKIVASVATVKYRITNFGAREAEAVTMACKCVMVAASSCVWPHFQWRHRVWRNRNKLISIAWLFLGDSNRK